MQSLERSEKVKTITLAEIAVKLEAIPTATATLDLFELALKLDGLVETRFYQRVKLLSHLTSSFSLL